jgi:hypothetical protein
MRESENKYGRQQVRLKRQIICVKGALCPKDDILQARRQVAVAQSV